MFLKVTFKPDFRVQLSGLRSAPVTGGVSLAASPATVAVSAYGAAIIGNVVVKEISDPLLLRSVALLSETYDAAGGSNGKSGADSGSSNQPGYSGPADGYKNQDFSDLNTNLGIRNRRTLEDLLASDDYKNPSLLLGGGPELRGTQKYIYVIDKNGTIWTSRAGPHHPDLVGGSNVFGAGEMYINPSGRIVRINDVSGHYKAPGSEFFTYMQNLLNAKGVSVQSTVFKPY